MKKLLLLAASLLTGMAAFAYQPTSNPTDPEWPADQVKAVYSEYYGADCGFGEWGSGTTYTQEEYGKKYVTTGLGYFGLEFTGMNCSQMEYLHLDLFADGTENYTIRVVPIHGGTEVGVTLTLEPTSNSWSRISIPLSAFTGVSDWTNVSQIKIDNAADRTFWLNNVYFYTEQEPEEDPEAPTNFSVLNTSESYFSATIQAQAEDNSGVVIFEVYDGENLLAEATGVSGVAKTINVGGLKANTNYAFTVKAKDETGNYAENEESVNITTLTAPAPAEAPTYTHEDVLSIYCDEYEQAKTWEMGSWGQSTIMTEGELAEGEHAQFCSNSNYLGWEFRGEPSALDCSEMTRVRFDVWVKEAATIEFTPIWGSEGLKSYSLEAGWNTIVEKLDNWSGIDKTSIYQLKWANMPSECFIDNVVFFKLPSGIIINVEVPTGTPSCAFFGALSDNQFVDMTMVDETHYTTAFWDKTADDLGWGYKFCWENGNWNTEAEPDSTYTVTDGSTIVVTGWQTEPGTSYRYTEYTEWKIKHGYDGEWTWEDLIQQGTSSEWWNNFTEESIYWDPSSGGINVGSCAECPIKKDWFTTAEIENGANFGEDDEILIILTVIDDETVTIKFVDPEEVAAVEAEAEAQGASYKVIENGKVIIITPAGKYDLLGAPIK